MKKIIIVTSQIVIIAVFIGCFSCTSKSKSNAYIHIDDIDNIKENSSLSSVFDEVKLIELETSEESLVGRKIGKIKEHENFYYVLNDNQYLLKFDKEGNLITKIDRLGGGPEEYSILGDYDILDNGNIAILDVKKILIYNQKGEYIESCNLGITGFNIKAIPNNNYLICASGEDYSVYLINQKGDIISKHLKTGTKGTIGKSNPFIEVGHDKVFFQYGYSNTILCYDVKKEEFTEFDFISADVINKDEELALQKKHGLSYLNSTHDINVIGGIVSYQDYMFFSYGNQRKGFKCFIVDNKSHEISHVISEKTDDDISFQKPLQLLNRIDRSDAYGSFVVYTYLTELDSGMKNSDNIFSKYIVGKSSQEIADQNPILLELKITSQY